MLTIKSNIITKFTKIKAKLKLQTEILNIFEKNDR